MKKYFLMLVVALAMPLLFTSCGDDDKKGEDPETPETPETPGTVVSFPYSAPNANWGSDVTSVKASMASSGLNLSLETAYALSYTGTVDGSFPIYSYTFTNGALSASSLAISDSMDAQYDMYAWLKSKYGEPDDEDDDYWYFLDSNSYVLFGYSENVEGWIATWTPLGTRGGFEAAKAAAKAHEELVKQILNK